MRYHLLVAAAYAGLLSWFAYHGDNVGTWAAFTLWLIAPFVASLAAGPWAALALPAAVVLALPAGYGGGEAEIPIWVAMMFVALVALTTSLVAMSIDTMLPALGDIARDLALVDPNDRQLVLTAFFGGLSVGQLVFGPVSDSIGRKPALYTGIALFVLGGTCCALAPNFWLLLAGRVVSGFGAAGPRIVAAGA